MHDLGLVVIWDDGDDLHAEPRAPYPHTRETLLLRAEREGTAALRGRVRARRSRPTTCSAPAGRTSWPCPRERLRERVTVRVAGASDAELARDPLARGARMPTRGPRRGRRRRSTAGPVLVQTPRLGYAAALACERCRTAARCAVCQGPLAIPRAAGAARAAAGAAPTTRAGRAPCAGTAGCGRRSSATPRTAEELGRTFPSTPVRTSSSGQTGAGRGRRRSRPSWWPRRGPSRSPRAGYAAVVLLDTWLMLARPDLRTAEEALRRWANAIGLVRPGGRAVAVGDPAHPGLQALVRWDLSGFAAREAAERASAHLPPASRLATITGEPGAVDDALTLLAPPDGGRGARAGARGRRRGPGRGPGARAPRAPALSRGAAGAAAGAVGPQARRRPRPGRIP